MTLAILLLGALATAVAAGLETQVAVEILVFSAGFVLLEWLVAPSFVQWVIPAKEIAHDGTRYITSHPIGAITARRCRDASVPLVRLGVVDDGVPNAFTFGRSRRSARVWVTRGLMERLNDDELDAVIAHEIGHIRNRDFVLMTLACAVPLALYAIGAACIDACDEDDDENPLGLVALAAFVLYLISEFVVRWLSRTRELAADHWSCQSTEKGDALVSALVKIGYGLTVDCVEAKARATARNGGEQDGASANVDRRRARGAALLGIFDSGATSSMASGFVKGLDAERAVAALRWEGHNPWAKVFEKFSTHPLIGRRIAELEASGLPGRPTWLGLEAARVTGVGGDASGLRRNFVVDATAAIAPWVTLTAAAVVLLTASPGWLGGTLLVAAGVLFFVAHARRYPFDFATVNGVTSLLERVDASPVRGIPVVVRGRIVGRATPGYILDADLVLEDESGIVALDYRSPIPFAAALFGFRRAERFIGHAVTARGWYRRTPYPAIELSELRRDDGCDRARPWLWPARFVIAVALVLAGVAVIVAQLATIST